LKHCLTDADFVNFVRNFDLIFCSETWQVNNDEFQLNGYKSVCVPRLESVSVNRKSYRGHGGVCLFIKETYVDGIHILETDQNGFIWIKLEKEYFKLEFDICLCFTYIPPNESVYFKSHEIGFYEQLEIGIRKYSQLGKICLMGDLNARTGTRDDFIEPVDLFD
jgi:exonuclease III